MDNKQLMNDLIMSLPTVVEQHSRSTLLYKFFKNVAHIEIKRRFSENEMKKYDFGPFGDIVFPYYKMGAIDSLDLFGLDELIIFSFYWSNRNTYKKVADIGANIGLHSLILSRCGFSVKSYEPDPTHFNLLSANLKNNNCTKAIPINAAVSKEVGEMEFIRVLGNTTGSHLAGSKKDPYGELEKFSVNVQAIVPILNESDFVKIDVEGHELTLLQATDRKHWDNCDAMIEIGSKENALGAFEHLSSLGVKMFTQKTGWQEVKTLDNMPMTYKEGSLFITSKPSMPWVH
jgi:FkbM family methyltransferase